MFCKNYPIKIHWSFSIPSDTVWITELPILSEVLVFTLMSAVTLKTLAYAEKTISSETDRSNTTQQRSGFQLQ